MLYLLLGPDDFSKREYIRSLMAKNRLETDFFNGADELPPLPRLAEQNLFSVPRIFAISQGIGQYELDEKSVGLLVDCANHIIFLEDKLDKRSTQNKKLLENKKINIMDFPLPHGREVNKWIEKRVEELGGKINPKAVELLAKKIGRDEAKETKFGGRVVEVREIFDLWQLDGEIKKLLAFAGDREIGETDVENLVSSNEEADVLQIIDALGSGNKQQTMKLLGKFMDTETGDDKAKVIQLNALLSDQFRSICIVQDFLAKKVPEDDILEKTSWKPGRLFVMKKNASKFKPQKVLETLNKLEALDEELKSSSTPPKVLLDLIISQLFVQ